MSAFGTDCRNLFYLVDELCKNIAANAGISLTEKQRRGILRHVTSYLSNCPNALGAALPLDEASITKKITNQLVNVRNNNASSGPKEKSVLNAEKLSASNVPHRKISSLFEQLKVSQLDPSQRSALLTFIYFMANSRSWQDKRFKAFSVRQESKPFGVLLQNHMMSNIPHSIGLETTGKSIENLGLFTDKSSGTFYVDHKAHKIYNSNVATQSGRCALETVNLSNNLKHVSQKGVGVPDFTNDIYLQFRNRNDEIVQNVIYSLTGIQGKYLKKDAVTGKFKLDSNIKSLSVIEAGMMLRLSDLGYYHDLVRSFTVNYKDVSKLGLMGQGFISSLQNELTAYYGMVAVLQEQLNKGIKFSSSEDLTLLKLLVWSVEPLERLQWLAKITETCRHKKGGALASTVYSFLNDGNPLVKQLSGKLLRAICAPLQQMLSRWMLEGEINDINGEFFIECISEVTKDRLWHDKYRVRNNMLPCFISSELAHKILITGKNINFLCVICEDKQPVQGGDDLRQCMVENPENIFSRVPDTKLHSIIETIYLNTSKRVLDMVVGPHKMLDHLQAMRRYLLLGQGDFISSLMESLNVELDKPAIELYSYDLSSIMDIAIRSTTAHYEDPDILNHLDVKLLKPCAGDVGWDILMLIYTVRGPLSTMLEPSMVIYQILFKSLWRMKHMEFVLSTKVWKEQKCNSKVLNEMAGELKGVLYRLHLFTSEMIHFIHQMEYYILFEVIECAWAALQDRVQQATALDDILNAHNEFLSHIKTGAFLDAESIKLNAHLESVYTGIMQLEVWQQNFYKMCFNELNARKKLKKEIEESEEVGNFELTNEKQLRRNEELKQFNQELIRYRNSLESIGDGYESGVRKFLMALNSHNDHNLQLFGIRLDFNEYYKKRDQSLSVPLTFEHMRMSNVYNVNNRSLFGSNRYSHQ